MKKWKIALGSAVGVTALLAVGYTAWCHSLEDQVIWEPVTVNGVSLAGKTVEEAKEAVQEQFVKDYEEAAIPVLLDGKTYEIKIFSALGLSADQEIHQAYELGHGEWYTRGLDYLKLQKMEPVSREVLPETVAPEQLQGAILETGIQKVNTLEETVCTQKETSLLLKKGKTGVKADLPALSEAILARLSDHEYQGQLECPVVTLVPKEVKLKPYYDQIYQKMSNAHLDRAQDYAIVPSVTGVSFDVKEAEKRLEEAEEGTEVVIDFTIEEPDISTEDLKTKLFRDVLGSYTTYGGGTSGRVNNIQLASNSCNDVILLPGETFSYNETVGERTAARGYQSATVYVNGQSVPGIGGGICQVSSTLFAASLYANLEIVERHNHSRTVAYLPSGMDATVSWGGPDYQFKNNTAYPIQLKVSYTGGAVQVQILGTKEEDSHVEVTTSRVDSYCVNTYRNLYDGQGNLIDSQQICSSRYRNPC